MDEAKRFIRYAMPGLVFFVTIIAAIYSSDSQKFIAIISKFNLNNGIAAFMGAFLSSGALGYIFSIFYFMFFRVWDHNHALILIATRCGYSFINENGGKINSSCLSLDRPSSWVAFNQIWLAVKGSKDGIAIKETDPYIERLCDILHGIGANIAGVISSISCWGVYYYASDISISPSPMKFIIILIVYLLLIVALIINYFRLRRRIQRLVDSAFINALFNQKDDVNKVIILPYYPNN